MYPTAAQIRKTGAFCTLYGGTHPVFWTDINGKQIAYKLFEIPTPTTKSKLKKIVRYISQPSNNYFTSDLPDHRHLNINKFHNPDIEIITLQEWKKHNIPTIDVLEKQEDAILTEYVESASFAEILKLSDYQSKPISKLFETVHKIRNTAIKHKNSSIYHSDSKLHNYLYSYNDEVAVAIDPGGQIKLEQPLEKIDSGFILTIMYSFLKEAAAHEFTYIEQLVSELSMHDRTRIAKDNRPISNLTLKYLKISSAARNLLSEDKKKSLAKVYSRENTAKINEILLSKNL